MAQNRERDDDQRFVSTNATGTLVQAAGMLRSGQEPMNGVALKPEERISVFWRVFGGTLLSIAALVCITIYQQFSNSINELRTNLDNVRESRGDLVKNEDFNNRTTVLWNAIKETQALSSSVSALKERSALLEQALKQSEEDRKCLTRELQQLRERLVVVEARQTALLPAAATAGSLK